MVAGTSGEFDRHAAGLEQQLLRVLAVHGSVDDDQLGERLGISRQSARGIALRLSVTGRVTRSKPPGRKWCSTLCDEPIVERTGEVASSIPMLPERTISGASALAAIARLQEFVGAEPPRARIGQLERELVNADTERLASILGRERIDDDVLRAALLVKQLAGEVNVVVHAVGILLALPYILVRGEQVLEASLGTGTGGRTYDLSTTQRIAEFKFTRWRGHDSVRQRELFADFVNLAEAPSDGRLRQLYVAGASKPLTFLRTSRRQLTSVCERRPEVLARIRRDGGESFQTVSDYVAARTGRVEIVDLEAILPAYLVNEVEAAATSAINETEEP
jgi:hypothetical protein